MKQLQGGEVLYIAGHTEDENSDSDSSEMYTERLILRVDPGQSEPVVVGQGQGNVPYVLLLWAITSALPKIGFNMFQTEFAGKSLDYRRFFLKLTHPFIGFPS
jgi:hypothetical protein